MTEQPGSGGPLPDDAPVGRGPAGRTPEADAAAPDARSYTERYRGTPFETRDLDPLAIAASAGRPVGRATRLLYWVGALLVIAALAGGAAFGVSLLGRGSTGVYLATLSPPGLRPSPTPTPGIPDDATVLDRFVAHLRSGSRSYRVAVWSSVIGAGRDATIQLTGSVSGSRWSGRATVTPASRPARTGQLVMIDGKWWYRVGSAGWRSGLLPFDDVPEVDPFAVIAGLGDLVYLGPAFHDGRWTYHLATRQGWISLSTAIAGWRPGWQFDRARMDIWVASDGSPIEAVYAAEIGITNTAVRHSFTTESTYWLSHVGEKVTITAP